METSDFTPASPGRLTRAVSGGPAFVPNPLPPAIPWDDELVSTTAAAAAALGRLAEVGQMMANPHLLIRPFLRREAVLSSQIEGTQASFDDLLLFELDEKVEQRVPDVREVANYVRALEHGLERVRTLPLSRRLICEMHGILMERVRGGDQTPGQVRRTQVHIGARNSAIEQARFVPPPPGPELDDAIRDLELYLNQPSALPAVVRLALVHYQFEAIHPFNDGNGRVGRLLVSLMLCVGGVLPQPLLYLSAYLERHRQAYYDHLLHVSLRGEWHGWLSFFARGVAEQAMDAVDRAGRLRELQARYVDQVQSPRTPALLIKLIEHLFAQPAVTAARVRQVLDVTPRTAQQHIDRLVKAGILREITGQKRNRAYVARGVLQAIHEPHHAKPAAEVNHDPTAPEG
ncbi:MAG: Fic family protein [Phycisphaeraceae bacterium]